MTYRARCEGRTRRIRSRLPLRKVYAWTPLMIMWRRELMATDAMLFRSLLWHLHSPRNRFRIQRLIDELEADLRLLEDLAEDRRAH